MIKKSKIIFKNKKKIAIDSLSEIRLPPDFIDLSYDHRKNELESKFQSTVIKIIKGAKNFGFEKYFKENCQKEYKYLTKIIDFNDVYQTRLDKENKFCRYSEIRTYKDNKVEINSKNGYINASWIHIPYHKSFIATQGPLESTLDDFYRILLEYDVAVIVMLTAIVEGDQVKCSCYWPSCKKAETVLPDGSRRVLPLGDSEDVLYHSSYEKDGALLLNSVEVRTVEEVVMDTIIKRVLCITAKNDRDHPHTVVQFQYKGWPDHDVPKDSHEIRQIVKMIEEERKKDLSPRRPIVVHCSAGLGRTGTFIAVHQNMLKMRMALSQGNIEARNYYINLYSDVLQMRSCRSGMVQQPAQYFFCYKAIAEDAVELGLIRDDTPKKTPVYGAADNYSDDDDDSMLDSDDSDFIFPSAPLARPRNRDLARSTTRNFSEAISSSGSSGREDLSISQFALHTHE